MYQRVTRASDQALLADRAEMAETFLKRLRGLTFRASLPEGGGLLLRPCQQIHMMFMRFPIDAAFLDQDNRIVALYSDLRPWWGITSYHTAASQVLELPAGTLSRRNILLGDLLHLEAVS